MSRPNSNVKTKTTATLPWLAKFNLELENIPAQGDGGIYGSALFRTLKRGLIHPNQYLQWAKEHYAMPLIKDEFFAKTPDPATFWHKWGQAYTWSAEVVPLTEWQDVLYVGALEPLENLPPHLKFVVVLAPWHLLEAQYQKLNPASVRTKNNDLEDLPDGFFEAETSNSVRTTTEITQLSSPRKRPEDLQELEAQIKDQVDKHTFKNVTTAAQMTPLAKIAVEYLDRMYKNFDHSALLEPRADGVRVTAWDSKWSPLKKVNEVTISLHPPSIFRIVSRSKQPFHGQIVMNETNAEFFSLFMNDPSKAKYVTMIPIIGPSLQVEAMLLGYSERDPFESRDSLMLAQKIAQKIGVKANLMKPPKTIPSAA